MQHKEKKPNRKPAVSTNMLMQKLSTLFFYFCIHSDLTLCPCQRTFWRQRLKINLPRADPSSNASWESQLCLYRDCWRNMLSGRSLLILLLIIHILSDSIPAEDCDYTLIHDLIFQIIGPFVYQFFLQGFSFHRPKCINLF